MHWINSWSLNYKDLQKILLITQIIHESIHHIADGIDVKFTKKSLIGVFFGVA
jgi:hypothetical protein